LRFDSVHYGYFSAREGKCRPLGRWSKQKEDWMKRATFLATAALLAMLVLMPMAMAQDTTMMEETMVTGTTAPGVPPSGGPAILLPAAALLLGSGILTYAILRRR
jgi:hypothetical protein